MTGSNSRPQSTGRNTLTQNSNDFIVLDDLQRAWHHKAEAVHTFARVVDEVAWGAVNGLKLHGKRSQTPVAGQSESRMLFEHLPVEMNADVRSHVFGANLQHLQRNFKTIKYTSCWSKAH